MFYRCNGLVLAGLAGATVALASSYSLEQHSVTASGGTGASTNFRARLSAGEAVVGAMSSEHFIAGGGQFIIIPNGTTGVTKNEAGAVTAPKFAVRLGRAGQSTSFQLDLVTASTVRLSLYNLNGRLTRTLIDGPMSAGSHVVAWNGTNNRGQRQASGIYFARVEAGAFVAKAHVPLIR